LVAKVDGDELEARKPQFGDDEFGRSLNFAQSDEDNPVAESLHNANLSYRTIKLLFGFSYKL
jgi:hypothetical protein